MKKPTILVVLALLLFTFNCAKKTEGSITKVSIEEMQTLLDLDKVQLVDVRTENEFKAGHLLNAQNINFYSPTFDEDIKILDKERTVILYCKSGGRSAKCAKKMEKAGFKIIYDLKEGYSTWQHITLDVAL